MKKLFLVTVFVILEFCLFAQPIPISFQGRDANNNWIQLNRVMITNITEGWQETIYWPDTTLVVENGTGIHDVEVCHSASLQLSQNNPNPFNGTTDVLLSVADAGALTLEIADVNGRIVVPAMDISTFIRSNDYSPRHQFRISLSVAGTYVMTARQNGKTSSIKMVNNGGENSDGIEYMGIVSATPKSHIRGNSTNPFHFGDLMEYVGYATINGNETESQVISQIQEHSETIILQFTAVQIQLPIVTTFSVANITAFSANGGGEVVNDGGDSITARGVCWSVSQNPTLNDSHTMDSTCIGIFYSNLSGLLENTTYYVRAYATNGVGTAYGDEVSFTTLQHGQPCPGVATVMDIDSNVYNTVLIGNQCWMKENLRTTRYADGTPILQGSTNDWSGIYSSTVPYWYYPNNAAANKPTYGLLYNFPAVMWNFIHSDSNPSGVQGVCPEGWHMPSLAEWEQLTDYVSSQSQYICDGDATNIAKALASQTGWSSNNNTCSIGNNPSLNNFTGFSALSAGFYDQNYFFGNSAYFWSTSETTVYSDVAYDLQMSGYNANVDNGLQRRYRGFSVRCLLGEGGDISVVAPTVTTSPVTTITCITADCGGNVTDDGGSYITARGVCWSTSPNPTTSDSHTTDSVGTGSFTSNMSGLLGETIYYVRAYASNNVGTGYGDEVVFTTLQYGQPCPGVATVTDRDSNTYHTVLIGNQCWIKENLRTTKYADGTPIMQGSDTSSTTAYWYFPGNDSINKATYGLLYNWMAVTRTSPSNPTTPNRVQGICPIGWHVPSDGEWTQLTNYVSSQSEYLCNGNSNNIAKALASPLRWSMGVLSCAIGNNPAENNATGFSALPAGEINYAGFQQPNYGSFLWSTTMVNDSTAYARRMTYDIARVSRTSNDITIGGSVRCLAD